MVITASFSVIFAGSVIFVFCNDVNYVSKFFVTCKFLLLFVLTFLKVLVQIVTSRISFLRVGQKIFLVASSIFVCFSAVRL